MPPQDAEQARWFAEEVLPHEEKLRAWLRSRFSAESDIDDILQEAYVRLLRARERGRLQSPKAFLFAIARNLVIDQIRRRKTIPLGALVENEALCVLDEAEDSNGAAARDKKLSMLTEAIQSLPDRCRQVFTLRKVYGLSQTEVAARLGISENTVSAQLTIGFNKCAEYVTKDQSSKRLGQ